MIILRSGPLDGHEFPESEQPDDDVWKHTIPMPRHVAGESETITVTYDKLWDGRDRIWVYRVANECSLCRRDFSSINAFDRHSVGSFQYSFREGLELTPPVEDGRRCRDEDELREIGLSRNAQGRWYDPAAAEAVRGRFAEGGDADD